MRAAILLCLVSAALLCVSGCEYNRIEVDSASESDESGDSASSSEADTVITLADDDSTVSGSGAKVTQNQVQITKAGTYTLSGTLRDGQICVETSGDGAVTLVFDGVSVTNEAENALDVEQAEEVILRLADGSDNLLQSGTSLPERADDDASGGALFTRDDLTITGDGTLTVNGYVNDGIHANDDVTIEGGTLVICAADDGIHANEKLVIKDGDLTVTDSYEGIEGNQIHIKGGTLSLTSSDDGINAYGGQNNLGFGRAGGASPDAGAQNTTEETPELIIDDGEIYVNAGGDGLDSNGDLIVNGGYVVVDGPTSSANGALDSGMENGGACEIHGGTVLAIGASGMAETFGNSSTQDSFRIKTDTFEGGSEIVITDADGDELFSHTAAKSFASIVFSSPALQTGEDYTVTVNGESYDFTQSSVSTAVTAQDESAPTDGQGAGRGAGRDAGRGGRKEGGQNPAENGAQEPGQDPAESGAQKPAGDIPREPDTAPDTEDGEQNPPEDAGQNPVENAPQERNRT